MTYDQADYFRIPLLDGSFGVGQVFELDSDGENIIFCGLSTHRTDAIKTINPLSLSDVIALVRVSDTALHTKQWPLAGFDQIPRFRSFFDYDGSAALGFPDTPVHDVAVIEAFTNAIHGLYPWDAFGNLFEKIKRPDIDKPQTAT
jgi:hypothetical protein